MYIIILHIVNSLRISYFDSIYPPLPSRSNVHSILTLFFLILISLNLVVMLFEPEVLELSEKCWEDSPLIQM